MESLDDVLAYIARIPERMCEPPQPRFLYELSHELAGLGAVVEIGTHAGKSTIALAYGQKRHPAGVAVYAVDPSEHPRLAEHLAAAGVDGWVRRLVARSSAAARGWEAPIALLWVDGDHSYRGLLTDLRLWAPHVVPGGVVAVHDYPGFDGADAVARAVRRALLADPARWRVRSDRDAGSIFAVERLPEPPARPSPLRRLPARLKWGLHSLRFLAADAAARLRGQPSPRVWATRRAAHAGEGHGVRAR